MASVVRRDAGGGVQGTVRDASAAAVRTGAVGGVKQGLGLGAVGDGPVPGPGEEWDISYVDIEAPARGGGAPAAAMSAGRPAGMMAKPNPNPNPNPNPDPNPNPNPAGMMSTPPTSGVAPSPAAGNFAAADRAESAQPATGYITGVGRGHSWSEDAQSIDVEVPIPEAWGVGAGDGGGPSKDQIEVLVEKNRIRVALRGSSSDSGNGEQTVLLEGPLFGAVKPSQSSWALLPPDARAVYRGRRVLVSLCKGYGWTRIWASVLDRVHLEGL